jgi:integral membrane sensor domain MASE1
MSLDYFGDSVANSIGDVLAMMAGYLVAERIPPWVAVACFVALELGLALWIRDGVLLNVLMLVAPAEAIKTWQLGGAPR